MLTLTIADMVPCVPFILNGAQLPECVKIFKYLRVSRKLLETLRFQSKRWKLDFIVSSSEFIQKKDALILKLQLLNCLKLITYNFF